MNRVGAKMASFSKLEIMLITLQVILALVDRGEGGEGQVGEEDGLPFYWLVSINICQSNGLKCKNKKSFRTLSDMSSPTII